MTVEEHARAAVELANLLETAGDTLTDGQTELLRRLQRHHGRLAATHAACDDCYLGFSLPDPDRSPECPACGGVYHTLRDAVGPDGARAAVRQPDTTG